MGSEDTYRIIVPTRDSARWIAPFYAFYRDLGVRPLYLVDSRSVDGTFAALAAMGADVAPVTPRFDRVEDMLALTRDVVSAAWLVRFDDDEVPSAGLIAWLERSLADITTPSLAMSRRDALFRGGKLGYSRLEDYYFESQDPTYLDPQWRAFRPGQVTFVNEIHSRGFEASGFHAAPSSAYFVHFDWMLRGFEQRAAKLARYERQAVGAGWGLAQFYLPELHTEADLRWTPFETDEFDGLARAVAEFSAKVV